MRRMLLVVTMSVLAGPVFAQPVATGRVRGKVTDETGGALPGVTVELRGKGAVEKRTVTTSSGDYAFDAVAPGRYQVSFALIISRAYFAGADPAAKYVPEAVNTVVSSGASVDNFHRSFGSVRLRYFGPRPLIDDGTVRSKATSLVNCDAGDQLTKNLRLTTSVFNAFDAKVSDIDYFFASRLPGEPVDGVEDIHVHPAVPRTARVSLVVAF